MRKLKVSEGWLKPMQKGLKPYDIRLGRRNFAVGEIVRFVENETNEFWDVRIINVLRSWEAPSEWKWDKMPDFEVLIFKEIK